MSYRNLVKNIIADTFHEQVGTQQSEKVNRTALLVRFQLLRSRDYEELHILLYAHNRSIQVWSRELRAGEGNATGVRVSTPWEKVGGHDVLYTEYIERVLKKYEYKVPTVPSGPFEDAAFDQWIDVIDVPAAIFPEGVSVQGHP